MHYKKLPALSVLALPISLIFSFFVTTAALAEGASADVGERRVQASSVSVASGIGQGLVSLDSTTAVTGSLTITEVAVFDIGATSTVITWTTDEDSDSRVRYGASMDSLTNGATNPVTGTHHAVSLANLTPSTEYFFGVESTDADGDTAINDNSGSYYSFTTLEAELMRKAFVGTVMGEPTDTITLLQNGNKGEVVIILPDDFVLRTPDGPRAGSLEDGAEVVILSQRAGDQWVALQVLVKPVKPNLPVVGVITGVGPTSITVLDHKGNPHMLRLENEVDSSVEGEVVTLFPGNSGQVRGLVRAEDIRQRLHRFLDEATSEGAGDDTEIEEEPRGKRADALIKRLEKHGDERIRLLDSALQRAPAEVKEKIEAGRARAQRGIEASHSAITRAKEKSGRSSSAGPDEETEGTVDSPNGIDDRPGSGDNKAEGKGKSGNQGNAGGQGSATGQDRDDRQGNSGRGGRGNTP
jgi:hypothetical protein